MRPYNERNDALRLIPLTMYTTFSAPRPHGIVPQPLVPIQTCTSVVVGDRAAAALVVGSLAV